MLLMPINNMSKFKMAAARFIQNICVNFYSKQLKTIGVIGKQNACPCITVSKDLNNFFYHIEEILFREQENNSFP